MTKACSNIVDLIESYSHLLDISSGLLSLNIASVINEHNQPTKENEKKFSLKLLKSLCGIAKLPTTAAGALRLYINSSSNQYRNLKTFLHAASLEYSNPSLDFLPNEKDLRKEDNSSLPGNVTYTICGSNDEVLYTHDAKVSMINSNSQIMSLIHFFQIEEPHNIEDAINKLGPLFYKPKIKGRYYHISDIVAKELLFMKNEIMDGYEKSGLSSSTVATVKIKIRCLFLNISCYN